MNTGSLSWLHKNSVAAIKSATLKMGHLNPTFIMEQNIKENGMHRKTVTRVISCDRLPVLRFDISSVGGYGLFLLVPELFIQFYYIGTSYFPWITLGAVVG